MTTLESLQKQLDEIKMEIKVNHVQMCTLIKELYLETDEDRKTRNSVLDEKVKSIKSGARNLEENPMDTKEILEPSMDQKFKERMDLFR